jgi:hypothetical protein
MSSNTVRAIIWKMKITTRNFEQTPIQNCSLLHSIQTGFGAHPASYPMGTGGCFSGVKRPRREADHSPLVPKSRMVGLYLHSTCLHGAVLSSLSTGTNLSSHPYPNINDLRDETSGRTVGETGHASPL